MTKLIHITEAEAEYLFDACLAIDTAIPPETVARAVLVRGLRELIAAEPSEARGIAEDAVRYLREVTE